MLSRMRTRMVGNGDQLIYYSDDAQGLSNWSIADVKREINGAITRPRFRLFWLNPDETVRTQLPNQDILTGGSYTENYQNGQRRSLSFSLFNELGQYTPSINGLWYDSKFSLEFGLETSMGDVLWFPKGVYYVTSLSVTRQSGTKTVSVQLGDKFSALEGARGTLETSYTIETGMLIEDIITNILQSPLGDGNLLDIQPLIYDPALKGKTTQASISKAAGATYGSILLELADQLSAEIFYDIEGHLTVVPINSVTNDVDKPIIFDFYEEQGDFGSNDLSFDANSVINRVIVIGSTINGEVCDAVAVNDDPASPLCYQRIGYRTAAPIQDSNITSTQLAQERADYELRLKLILKTTSSVSTRYNPLLSVNNLISVTDSFYNFEDEKFLLQSISCPLDYSGTMSISSTAARNLPFVVS